MSFSQFALPMLAAMFVVTAASGCSASRWLSRKDYAEMGDPFLAFPQVAESSASSALGSGTTTSAGEGIVRLGQPGSTSGASAAGRSSLSGGSVTSPLSGPKPIQTAATLAAAASRPAASQAQYPDAAIAGRAAASRNSAVGDIHPGPSLSDFMSSGADPSAEKSITATRVSRTVAAPGVVDDEEFAAFDQYVKSNGRGGLNSGATHSPGADRQSQIAAAEWEGQSSSLDAPQSESPELSSNTVVVEDPWASTEPAFAQPTQTGSGRQIVGRQHAPAPVESLSDSQNPFGTNSPQIDASWNGEASPLVAGQSGAEVQGNPFTESAGSQTSSGSGMSQKKLDTAFQMDSGWKPANFIHP